MLVDHVAADKQRAHVWLPRAGCHDQGHLSRFSVRRILQWADAHHRRMAWPTALTGPVYDVPGENWRRIDGALQRGSRRLKRDTLAELLARHRGHRNKRNLPRLTIRQILQWATAYHAEHGRRPTKASGPIGDTGETWEYVDEAMRKGFRGLPGGSSLFRLLRSC